ncbi:MAG: CARDB domain-containing protein [Xenococcaceae cyanobacterium]
MVTLYVANTITDLVVGDIYEHLPITQIPLAGDVVGLGTTTSIDNGELSFIYQPAQECTNIYKCNPYAGRAEYLPTTSDLVHFPYVCYTTNAKDKGIDLPLTQLPQHQGKLQPLVEAAIDQLEIERDYWGIRLNVRWQSLVITVASKLCLWQQKHYNHAIEAPTDKSVYGQLKHFKFAPAPSTTDTIEYLSNSLDWYLAGFYAKRPETGLVTVPQPGQNLHIHGCSTDLRYGGHVHHDHPETELLEVTSLRLYPITRVETLQSDLCLRRAMIDHGVLSVEVHNVGQMDADNVDIDIVTNNSYRDKLFYRIPWLSAGSYETIRLRSEQLPLQPGPNNIEIIVDPNNIILETAEENNRCYLQWNF